MKRLFSGFFVSCLVHAVLFGGSLGWIAWDRIHGAHGIDIDLAGSSLLMRPANAGSRAPAAAPPQPWILAMKGHAVPRPQAQPATQTAQPEDAGPVCPPPCPQNSGDWMPAAAASRRPQWDEGMLTEDDYPSDLKLKGIEGKVIAEVLIDAAGNVKGVTIEQGAAPEFNQLVLDRLKQSKFMPAYDQNGNAVACRLRLPLLFKIRQ